MYGIRECSNIILLHVDSSFPTPLIGDCLSSTICSCLLCHILIDHRCLGLFLGSLLCSIDLYVLFLCQYHTAFDDCSLVVLSKVREPDSSSSTFLFQDFFGYFGILMLNLTDYWRNENQNYNEVQPHTSQNGHD